VAKQKFGLGKGLDALISGASDVMSAQQAQTGSAQPPATPMLPIDSIIPNPRQPRHPFPEDDPQLLELCESIKEHGLIQPIVVCRLDSDETPLSAQPAKSAISAGSNDWFSSPSSASSVAEPASAYNDGVPRYQIIAGERRWRASRLAGLTEVPVVIKDVTPLQMLEMALIENIQRSDLNPIEEALAYQALMQEFGLTQEQVADQVGKKRATVANSLRLLQLSPRVREALITNTEHFTEGHARALIGIEREEDQITAMQKIIAQHLNVRQAEELGKRIRGEAVDVDTAVQQVSQMTSQRDSDLASYENEFREALAVKVNLKLNAKGKGTLVLHFNSQDELEGLYSRLVKRDQPEQ
jgi:ParB family chromosome partitioning protein